MQNPTVSFVIPCYRLAHLLPQCINSILSQTYRDFEILIMDDCSPDDTPAVARSFTDPRVQHIRNDPNLGHLHNYNKGIRLARGKYIWLISADDYLRKPYVLERYVRLMDQHPNVGYVFCPCVGDRDGVETQVWGRYPQARNRDRVIPGHELLRKLVRSDFVMASSGMVRRDCYETVSVFPLDMPWCGDWYLWCLFALSKDVGYLAEPMVGYREQHSDSMTTKLTRDSLDQCAKQEVAVPWIIRKKAAESGHARLAQQCLAGIAQTYARVLASERFRPATCYMNFELLEASLQANIPSEADRSRVPGASPRRYWKFALLGGRVGGGRRVLSGGAGGGPVDDGGSRQEIPPVAGEAR